jgi:hypothetical protein
MKKLGERRPIGVVIDHKMQDQIEVTKHRKQVKQRKHTPQAQR